MTELREIKWYHLGLAESIQVIRIANSPLSISAIRVPPQILGLIQNPALPCPLVPFPS